MITKIKRYFTEVKMEWNKVSKPPYREVWGSTGVVIVATAILAFYLGFLDFILGKLRMLYFG
ncbi:preprotein translocase subunit SecE [Candidatus Poribacteria bacterium]|nr:preprotein translocase subunit SecE [Candidatus Poribacteria bacterium]